MAPFDGEVQQPTLQARPVHGSVIQTIIALSASTDRIVTRRSLVDAGISRGQVDRQVRSGLMSRVLQGVYVVGAPRLTQRELCRASLAADLPTSTLAETSAAEARLMLPWRIGHVSVSVPRPGSSRTRRTQVPMVDGHVGIVVFRTTDAVDGEEIDGLRCARMARTLVDLAAARGEATLRRAWREADYLRLLDLDEIGADLAAMSRKGVSAVEALLAEMPRPIDAAVRVRTRTELQLLRLIEAAGLPRPGVDVPRRLDGTQYRFDFFYEELGLVVELDDASHTRPSARVRDAERDRRCRAAGLVVLRITTAQLRPDPEACVAAIRAAITSRLRGRPWLT